MNTLPNKLTISRFIIAPIFAVVFLSDIISYECRYYVAFALFLLGMLTDLFDGIIARKFKCISGFGIVADSIADKVLLMTAIVSLMIVHRLHPYVVIALVFRDFLVCGLRIIQAKYDKVGDKSMKVLEPPLIGKLKTVAETVLVLYLLLNLEMLILDYVFISATVALSLLSAALLIKKSTPTLKLAYYDYQRKDKEVR
jgi:CDP-diacylglycerol--glycerol-3-phosphate 3-phosphatidyltransferase